MESPSDLSHAPSGSMLTESEELEVCCICLDSLCAQPVAALFASDGTCCQHYMHATCAERLRPRRCPICRSGFKTLTTPISKEVLEELGSTEIMCGLRQLSGRARPVPGRVAVALLAALLPMRQGTLKSYVAAHGDALDLEGLEALLRRVGLGRGNARPGLPSYAPSLRLFRRSRWLALKLAGATGAALHLGCSGMACGMVLGCLGALPRLRLRQVRHIDYMDDLDTWQALLVYIISVVFVELLVLSIRDPRWVKRGLRWGAGLGALLGWLRALAVVDPDRHSFRSVFQSGVLGQTTWSWRALIDLGPVEKIDIFKG